MAVQLLKKPSLKNTKILWSFCFSDYRSLLQLAGIRYRKIYRSERYYLVFDLGAVIGSTGLVPLKILDHAKSSGIFNVGVFAVIIPSLAKIKVSDLLVLSFNTIMVFIVVFAVLFLFFYICRCGKSWATETWLWV